MTFLSLAAALFYVWDLASTTQRLKKKNTRHTACISQTQAPAPPDPYGETPSLVGGGRERTMYAITGVWNVTALAGVLQAHTCIFATGNFVLTRGAPRLTGTYKGISTTPVTQQKSSEQSSDFGR